MTSITGSPGRNPCALSAAASAATRAATSCQLIDVHFPSALRHSIGTSPFCAARAKNIVTRLGNDSMAFKLSTPAGRASAGRIRSWIFYKGAIP
jgi:hypothetical protein